MKQIKPKKKALAFSALMMVLLLFPLTMNAQYDKSRNDLQPWFKNGMLDRSSTGGYNLNNQQFGSNNGGYGLYNQTFGEDEEPLGNGLAILVVAGMGYAATKSRKKNQKSNK